MNDLQFQNLNDTHKEGLLAIWSDREVIKFTNIRTPFALDDVSQLIEIFKPFDVFTVFKKEQIIGIIGCPPINKATQQFGFFYQFCKSSWGEGNATTAAKWLVDYMKQKYKKANLYANVIVDNVASEKILKNLNFQQIKEEITERDNKFFKIHNYKLEI